MAKILMINLPYVGHTNPTLLLTKELVQRGHSVSYINAPEFRESIEETGAKFIPYINYPEGLHFQQIKIKCFWAAFETGLSVGEDYDIIIYEMFFFLGKLLAECLQKPCIRQFSTFAWNKQVEELVMKSSVFYYPLSNDFAKKIVTELVAHKIDLKYDNIMDEIAMNVPDLNIVYTSREFQILEEQFDQRFQFVGPALEDKKTDVVIPYQSMKYPIIYISLGNALTNNKRFLKKCIEAFGHKKVNVIMSIGPFISEEGLGEVPGNIYIYQTVPQLDVLRHASLLITHGGMNSIGEAMYYGVPMILVPMGTDQPMNTDRVEEFGLGKKINWLTTSARNLSGLAYSIIKDQEIKERCETMKCYMQQAGGITRAADCVEEYMNHEQ
ncbi:MAG: glycosyl transferase [Clostridia bacterium]|nr:glycosyl transferase [Clostridia bacterium]